MSGEYPFDPSIAGVKQAQPEKKGKTPKERLESLKEANTLSLDVPFSSVRKIKTELEETLGISLKNREEAHITLIRPIDSKILREGLLSAEDLHAFETCVNQPVEISGIGTIPPGLDAAGVQSYIEEENRQAAADPKFKPKGVVFFAVIRLPEGVQAKLDALIDLVNEQEPNPKKHATKVNPHVTIGFTLKDRFDGSKADVNSNFEKPITEISYEKLRMLKPTKDAQGNFIKGPDGNQVSEYVDV